MNTRDGSQSPDYKDPFLSEQEAGAQKEAALAERLVREGAGAAQWEAEIARLDAETVRLRAETLELNKKFNTTFSELVQHCHNIFSQPVRVGHCSYSEAGLLPPATEKCCPLRLRPWKDCTAKQQEIYDSICHYLEPEEGSMRVFPGISMLQKLGNYTTEGSICCKRRVIIHGNFAVGDHVDDIIAELCKLQTARDTFGLGDGVSLIHHGNALDETEIESQDPPAPWPPRSEQLCIYRVDGDTHTFLTTVDYQPPHELSVENLRVGLRSMNFWDELVGSDSIPVTEPEKLRYNAEQLAGSAVVETYHTMIQEGLEYSCISTGLALILLRVPFDDPGTLYYRLCEPNEEVKWQAGENILQPTTALARVLCLCLMSFQSPLRSQEWRNNTQAQLPVWKTSFDLIRSQIPKNELKQKPPDSGYTSPEYIASEPLPPLTPSTSQSKPQLANPQLANSRNQRQQHNAQFCTQRCLIGLQNSGNLDYQCPNVKLHQQGGNSPQHLINTESLVQQLREQLDETLDHNCTPFGDCGGFGAPFKITSTTHGYTLVGKGTTLRLWPLVSREVEIYQVLKAAQCSAVPVFLGTIDLSKTYFLHGAGAIRHMLLMAWGGHTLRKDTQVDEKLQQEITKSSKEILSLGVTHEDLRMQNILWNDELQRAQIIDFHLCQLNPQPVDKKLKALKRASHKEEKRKRKKPCVPKE
ncbi:hypothetical protein BO71DRAFT_443423 [Aspergillus ellipticus CBS 707.79]|uniref:Protein kinase domain-containing protein n=1 Tax=Aspergillus ellipticus CBS 707.79 TaxID=1448320 RepID=A0A319D221_9EURO|nr:hypothetical protein BO71DRAFT_443423 [Aspergillus ellipticus CBS 707.79]